MSIHFIGEDPDQPGIIVVSYPRYFAATLIIQATHTERWKAPWGGAVFTVFCGTIALSLGIKLERKQMTSRNCF